MIKKVPRLFLVFLFTISVSMIFVGGALAQDDTDEDLTADELYDRGYGAYLDGDYEVAIEDFTSAIELDTTLADAYFYRALSNYNLGNGDENMVADLDSALENDFSDMSWAYNIRGLINARMENFEQAIADYTEAITLSSTYGSAYGNRALAYSAMGDWVSAAADRKIILELDPSNEGSYNNLAWAYVQIGRYEEALAYVLVELEGNPDLDYAIDTLGWAYLGLGEYFDAIDTFERAIALGEDYSYYGLGVAYSFLGAQTTAIENLQTYVDIFGEDAEPEAVELLNELQSE